VVERQTDELECVVTGSRGVTAGVLDLLDQVLVALLGEAAALLSVQVHIVGPDLEVCAEVGAVVGSQVKVQANLVVLEGNQGEIQTWVAVEEEKKGEVDTGLVTVNTGGACWKDVVDASAGRDHLTPCVLVGLVEENLGIQAPPGLVVLVDALTTDGHLDISQGALGDPARVENVVVRCGVGGYWKKAHVHIAHQVTVASNSNRHAARVGRGTVDSLLDVLHRKVGVALVDRLKESHLGLTRQIHILGAISYELHKSSGHFGICQEKNLEPKRALGKKYLNNTRNVCTRRRGKSGHGRQQSPEQYTVWSGFCEQGERRQGR